MGHLESELAPVRPAWMAFRDIPCPPPSASTWKSSNAPPRPRGFTPLPRRWAVERTYGWLMFHLRLTRDYETLPASFEAMIHLAMTDLMARRLTGETTVSWRDPTSRDETQSTG
jgi:hypothetical protein